MQEKRNRSGVVILVLLIIIILLLGILAYIFLIYPKFNGYIINKQIEAQNILVTNMLYQLQQQGFVQLGVGNQTVVLIPYNPNQNVPVENLAG